MGFFGGWRPFEATKNFPDGRSIGVFLGGSFGICFTLVLFALHSDSTLGFVSKISEEKFSFQKKKLSQHLR